MDLSTGIWVTGLIVQVNRNSKFEPLAVVGGVLWCTGNMFAVPVIQCIGIGLGLLIWGASSLALGWASGNFGLFGIDKNTVSIPALNYVGFVVSLCSMGIFFFVKTSDNARERRPASINQKLIQEDDEVSKEKNVAWNHHLDPLQKQALGCFMAVLSGIFYGLNFVPPQYLIDHPTSFNSAHSTETLDYVFSHFTGIFLSSTTYFLVYCMLTKNQPTLPNQIVLPSFVSGVMWAIAQISFFIANENLEFVVSFPIISTGPGLIASLWGFLFFREIQGARNIRILLFAYFVTLSGVTMIALSKILN